ncbi:MAG TPA: hypothetical protein VFS05_15545 [Gemmatimonadaceae bacterium]|nr:hypothetical protein [Gemmatimonadaceae bacterium]
MQFPDNATAGTMEEPATTGTGASMAPPPPTQKLRAAVQREVTSLLDELAPERPTPKANAPLEPVRRHRSPGRCVLQGDGRAVSVSWFPGQPADDSLGELLIIAWQGVVSLPGSAHRERTAAKPLETVLLHPVASADGHWAWRPDGDARKGEGFVMETLAAYCRDLLQE